MSGYTAIGDIGNTIIKLLQDNIKEITAESIFLGMPDDSMTAKISLYLYKVEENAYMRNQETFAKSCEQAEYPPMVLDLYYLLTVYLSAEAVGTQVAGSHAILGKAMQVLYDNSILRGSILQGGLSESGEEFRISMNPLTVEDLTKIWDVFPKKVYKTSIGYLVTPVAIKSKHTLDTKRVISSEMKYSSESGEKIGDSV